MPAADESPRSTDLLCEHCGYVLVDLDPAGDCPECGRPIAESQPGLRPGSPYQNRKATRQLIQTWFLTLFLPRRTIERLEIDKQSGISLMWRGLCLAVLVFTLSYFSVIVLMLVSFAGSGWGLGAVVAPALMIVAMGLVFWLICVGYAALAYPRVRVVARHRAQRMPSALAWTIVGQASLGLTLAPLMLAISFLTQFPLALLLSRMDTPSPALITLSGIVSVMSAVLVLLAIPIALIEFEVLLSMCTRRLRYRNFHARQHVRPSHVIAAPDHRPDAGPRVDIT